MVIVVLARITCVRMGGCDASQTIHDAPRVGGFLLREATV